MTSEEAINHLSILFERISDTYEPEIHIADIPLEAIDMAIKALKTPPDEDWEKYSDKLYNDALEKYSDKLYNEAYTRGIADGLEHAAEVIKEQSRFLIAGSRSNRND